MAKRSKLDNLVTRHLTTEEATEMGSKGGKASVEARRKRKTQREQLELLLALPVKSEKAKLQLINLGLNEEEIDNQMAMNVAMFQTIIKGGAGSVQAYNSIIEILGDKDIEKKELEIKRLKEEINKLKLEQEKLKKDLNFGADSFENLDVLADKMKFTEEELKLLKEYK